MSLLCLKCKRSQRSAAPARTWLARGARGTLITAGCGHEDRESWGGLQSCPTQTRGCTAGLSVLVYTVAASGLTPCARLRRQQVGQLVSNLNLLTYLLQVGQHELCAHTDLVGVRAVELGLRVVRGAELGHLLRRHALPRSQEVRKSGSQEVRKSGRKSVRKSGCQ